MSLTEAEVASQFLSKYLNPTNFYLYIIHLPHLQHELHRGRGAGQVQRHPALTLLQMPEYKMVLQFVIRKTTSTDGCKKNNIHN